MEITLTGLLTWTSILSLTILVCSFVCFQILLKRKEKALALARQSLMEWKMQAELLEADLRQSKNKLEMQRLRIKCLEEANREMTDQYLSMFRSQFADISRLLRDRFFSLGCAHPEAVLANEVDILLERISGGPDGLGELVGCINRHFDNVLVHLRKEMPRMAEADFKMFCYYCIGIPPEVMYPLVGLNNISNLYLRKKRLSDKIAMLNSERRELYLVLLASSRAEKHCRVSLLNQSSG